ncbi:MAG: hypothetical protein Q9226_005345 [Calogaya cf. arnoldii]
MNNSGRAKRQIEKSEPDLTKKPKRPGHIKLVKDVEKALYNLEDTLLLRDALNDARAETKEQKATTKTLRKEMIQLTKDRTASDEASQHLVQENISLKMDMLKQQPADQPSDSQLAERYRHLGDAISTWVDNELTRFEIQWALDHDGIDPEKTVFRAGGSPAQSEFLSASYVYGGEYLVESFIHSQLHELLFADAIVLVGLEESEMKFVRMVEEGLTASTPAKGEDNLLKIDPRNIINAPADPSTVAHLRSEILTGFTKAPEFGERRKKWKGSSGVSIYKGAVAILPEPNTADLAHRMQSFTNNVLSPAFDLAVSLKTSTTQYGFSELLSSTSRFRRVALKRYQMLSCTMINIDTREALKTNNIADTREDAVVAKQVLFMVPGLVKSNSGVPLRLTNDIVYVTVDKRKSHRKRNEVKKEDGTPDILSDEASNSVASVVIQQQKKEPARTQQHAGEEHASGPSRGGKRQGSQTRRASMKEKDEDPDFVDDEMVSDGAQATATRRPKGKASKRKMSA